MASLHLLKCPYSVLLLWPAILTFPHFVLGGEERDAEIENLKSRIEELQKKDAENREDLRRLRLGFEDLEKRSGAKAEEGKKASSPQDALDRALEESGAPEGQPAPAPGPQRTSTGDLYSRQVGSTNFRLIDISFDILAAFGTSTERDAEIEHLQGGGHDPKGRGATLQQAEISLSGAVDPYFQAEGHFVGFACPDGEAGFETEEAFFETLSLPCSLQLKGGYFLTEYGRINPTHPHAWDWIDQPIINTRLFGPDGMRSAGLRLSWLLPIPIFSQIFVGAQNAGGTTSFGSGVPEHDHEGGDEEEGEGDIGIGGWPTVNRDVRSLEDFVYLARWEAGFDLGPSWSMKPGVSGLFGPNETGADARTNIVGTDLVVKWRPPNSPHGWPFLIWQSEFSYRNLETGSFVDSGDLPDDPIDDRLQPGRDYEDWGLYTQLVWGFIWRWAAGARYEYVNARGAGLEGTDRTDRQEDPFRDERHRISPLVMFQPTHFSRIRLQYNYDLAAHLDHDDAHSVWLGFEVLFGSHPAHSY